MTASTPNDGAGWVTCVHAGRLKRAQRRALRAWIAAAPENARDFLRAETIWRLSGCLAHDAQTRADLQQLRAARRAMPRPTAARFARAPLPIAAALGAAVVGV